jgi:hypothetical protein
VHPAELACLELARRHAAWAIRSERQLSDALAKLSLDRVLQKSRLDNKAGIGQSVAAIEGLERLIGGYVEQLNAERARLVVECGGALAALPEELREACRVRLLVPIESWIRMQAALCANLRRWSDAAREVCRLAGAGLAGTTRTEAESRRYVDLLDVIGETYGEEIARLGEHKQRIAKVYAILYSAGTTLPDES